MTNLRDKAFQALDTQEQHNEKVRQTNRKRFKTLLQDHLGIDVEPDDLIIVVDDISLALVVYDQRNERDMLAHPDLNTIDEDDGFIAVLSKNAAPRSNNLVWYIVTQPAHLGELIRRELVANHAKFGFREPPEKIVIERFKPTIPALG